MSTVKSFEDLTIWQESRKFTNKIYESPLKTPIKQIANILFQNWAIGGI